MSSAIGTAVAAKTSAATNSARSSFRSIGSPSRGRNCANSRCTAADRGWEVVDTVLCACYRLDARSCGAASRSPKRPPGQRKLQRHRASTDEVNVNGCLMANPSRGGGAKLEVSQPRDSSAASLSSRASGNGSPGPMGGYNMNARIRVALVAALSSLGLALAVPMAHANVLSLLSPCSSETYSHPFAQWGDNADYTSIPGGSFEGGTAPWLLTGGAAVSDGNESYNVGDA